MSVEHLVILNNTPALKVRSTQHLIYIYAWYRVIIIIIIIMLRLAQTLNITVDTISGEKFTACKFIEINE